jgi:hypothetical protein
MDIRFGVRGTVYDGVFFTEAHIPGTKVIRHLNVEISRQNADLSEVKQRLAAGAHDCDGTAIMNFRYGQKKHHSWELLFTFKWDTESWHGSGDAVKV